MISAKTLFLKSYELRVNTVHTDELSYAFMYNKDKGYLFSQEDWADIIDKSDLHHYSPEGATALMVALKCNKDQQLNLGASNWDKLIKGSNIYQRLFISRSSVMDVAIANSAVQELPFTEEQWGWMISKTDLCLFSNRGQCVALDMYSLTAESGFSEVLKDFVMDSIDLDLVKVACPGGYVEEYLRLVSLKERFLFKKETANLFVKASPSKI